MENLKQTLKVSAMYVEHKAECPLRSLVNEIIFLSSLG